MAAAIVGATSTYPQNELIWLIPKLYHKTRPKSNEVFCLVINFFGDRTTCPELQGICFTFLQDIGKEGSFQATMRVFLSLLSSILLVVAGANAQFGFFEQMFHGHQQHHQQQPQNVPSDSSWYQQNYDNGSLNPIMNYRWITL
jgi:hypothetical protein